MVFDADLGDTRCELSARGGLDREEHRSVPEKDHGG